MKRTSTYKTGHAPITLQSAMCMITLLIDGARNLINYTNRLHSLALQQRSHIQELHELLAEMHCSKTTKKIDRCFNITLYLPNPHDKTPENRIASDFSKEIDRFTDILHDNTGYKWIDNTE